MLGDRSREEEETNGAAKGGACCHHQYPPDCTAANEEPEAVPHMKDMQTLRASAACDSVRGGAVGSNAAVRLCSCAAVQPLLLSAVSAASQTRSAAHRHSTREALKALGSGAHLDLDLDWSPQCKAAAAALKRTRGRQPPSADRTGRCFAASPTPLLTNGLWRADHSTGRHQRHRAHHRCAAQPSDRSPASTTQPVDILCIMFTTASVTYRSDTGSTSRTH